MSCDASTCWVGYGCKESFGFRVNDPCPFTLCDAFTYWAGYGCELIPISWNYK